MDISAESISGDTGDNRRSCVRFSELHADDHVVLCDRTTRIAARCTDRSAEGFGFCCESKIPWTVGQTILLSREEGSYEVRIAYILDQDGKERIGVQRVRDFATDAQLTSLRSPWGWLRRPQYYKGHNDLWVLGLCVAGLACVAVAALMLHPFSPFQSGKRSAARQSSNADATRLFDAWASNQGNANRSPSADWNGSRNRRRVSSDKLWAEIVSGTREVTWIDVEDLLSLTGDQSQRLLALLNEKLNEVSAKVGTSPTTVADGRAQLASLIESLPDKALSFLDNEQRAKLKSLLVLLSQT